MGLKVDTRMPLGNGRRLDAREQGDTVELAFAPEPKGGRASLWFYFRLAETKPDRELPAKLRLILRYVDTLDGGQDLSGMRPVLRHEGDDWVHIKQGRLEDGASGPSLVWEIDYPRKPVEVALNFPCLAGDIRPTIEKSKGYWQEADVGLSGAGRGVSRICNDRGKGQVPGIAILARQYGADVAASWLLDGLMRELARLKHHRSMVWIYPFANPDGMARGEYGRRALPVDPGEHWGQPPGSHEAHVIQTDLSRWSAQCTPFAALELVADPALLHAGCIAMVPQGQPAGMTDKAQGLASLINDRFRPDFAGEGIPSVSAVEAADQGHAPGSFVAAVAGRFAIPGITVSAPACQTEGKPWTRNRLRDVGKALAAALDARLR